MNIDPKLQAVLWRFLIGLAIVDLPLVADQVRQPTFDWKLLAAGLIGGLVTALEKFLSPQLADTYLSPKQPTDPGILPPH